ncbi:MAG: Na+:solute symporter, partial [Candidatus Aminicenantes bacterium]|nr:Na+:solute symporter [Candidatus Aminicenantes bacterium]
WILVTLLTKPSDKHTLRSFYRLVRPGGPGWKKVLEEAEKEGDPVDADGEGWDVPAGIVCMSLGCLAVYSTLFATGNFIYGKTILGAGLAAVAVVSTFLLTRAWKKLRLLN